MIPTTLAGLLVIVLALLPGVPGDRVYRMVAGVSWREKHLDFVLRLLLFSTIGLALYAVIAATVGWPDPRYVVPSTFSGDAFGTQDLPSLSAAYVGHMIGSTTVGVGAALGRRMIAKYAAVSAHRDAWDHFVEFCVPGRWVVVTLKSGDSFLAMVDHADINAEPEHRDVILSEPAEYDSETASYISSTKQTMFLRGEDVASVATVFDSLLDERIVDPETTVLGGSNERKRKERETAAGL